MGDILYIRRQDKKRLYAFGIAYSSIYCTETRIFIEGTAGQKVRLGEYESEARCIEIIKDIEKACHLQQRIFDMPSA